MCAKRIALRNAIGGLLRIAAPMAVCLLFVGCATAISPQIPRRTPHSPNLRYRLSDVQSAHRGDTREYIEAQYADALCESPSAPEISMGINYVHRRAPNFAEGLLSAFTLGLLPRTYSVRDRCNLTVQTVDGHQLSQVSSEETARLTSWGYLAQFGDTYAATSSRLAPAERRAEILAASSAMDALLADENTILAKLMHHSNRPSPDDAPTRPQQHAPTGSPASRWAVIIGLSKYRDTRVPALRYAGSDAQAFHDWAVSPEGGRHAPARVRLLLDERATAANIKDALFNWLGQALEEDVVTIYFAGHGSPQSPDHADNLFLLPYDCQYDNIPTTGFPMWDIETALKRYIKAKRVVVIADACHSGGVGQSFDIARRANRGLKVNPISTAIHSLSEVGEGVCVISASDENQYSQESQDWGGGHGVFTYFLLRGLKGDADYNRDTSVTLGELTSYLSQEVRRATKNAQSPTVAGRYDPALTIGK